MRIIPAIDIIDGKCVRLTKGDYSTQKIYNQDPLEVAKQFEDAGLQFLHLVDLDGAKSQHIVNYKVLEKIALKTNLKIDFGGGIKNDEAVRIAFENGASQITVGSISYQNPNLFEKWLAQFGADKIILGADAKNRFVATQGWLTNSETDVVDFIADFESKGVEFVVCTDIAKDGMLEGPSVVLYQEILQKTNVKLIASGGVSSMRDLEQLQAIGCEGAIIGKAIYEGKITLKELRTLC
uniref:1-(5-phosphoribosyl)-5-[(5- phosphoribosylamino)methylideneamino]imidazole-4- carboxamide isomerase n=1 Tax=Flavobacterium sp. TaxID=239 RepID=UPI004049CE0F